MNRATKTTAVLGVLALLLSCGTGTNNSSQTTKIKTRAFVTNSFSSAGTGGPGTIDLIDYSKTILYSFFISVGANPQNMLLTPDGAKTLVNNVGTPSVSVIDNSKETGAADLALPAAASSIVLTPDSKLAYAATRNANVSGAQLGAVQVLDLVNLNVYGQIPVPLAQTLALSPDGKKMLVFKDGMDTVSFIDLTSLTASTPTIPVPVDVVDANAVAGHMSRPVMAIFSSDGTKAYVANCGTECGAEAVPDVSLEGITVIDMTTTPPTAGPKFSVSGMGASTMLLDGSTLYVAGTIPGQTAGSLTVLTVSGSTLGVAKNPVDISLGFHNKMTKAADSTLFIGATGCPNVTTPAGQLGGGCLSIYDTSTAGVTVTNNASGFVTGMTAVPGKSLVYVVEGGELNIYNTKTKAILQPPCPNDRCFMDVVGTAQDVLIIDK